MLNLIAWIIYGLIVGSIAKWLHPGEDPIGFIPTVIIGMIGSMIGGLINYFATGSSHFEPAGIIMGIVGGIIFCWTYRTYKLEQYIKIKTQELRQNRNK